jgi:hypothetical protein
VVDEFFWVELRKRKFGFLVDLKEWCGQLVACERVCNLCVRCLIHMLVLANLTLRPASESLLVVKLMSTVPPNAVPLIS